MELMSLTVGKKREAPVVYIGASVFSGGENFGKVLESVGPLVAGTYRTRFIYVGPLTAEGFATSAAFEFSERDLVRIVLHPVEQTKFDAFTAAFRSLQARELSNLNSGSFWVGLPPHESAPVAIVTFSA